jgi:hypothetical protein
MKILLAIDGSPYSDAAVAEVGQRPWPAGSEVRVITVDPRVDPNLLQGRSSTRFFSSSAKRPTDASKRRWRR